MKDLKNILTIACLLITGILSAQINQAEFEKYINDAVVDYELPGVNIALSNKEQIVFQHTNGYANVEDKIRLEPNAVFGIASLSKAFTAAAIGILVDQGKLNWTDKVNQYIPGFKLSDPIVTASLTVEDLLAHRSGFATFDGDLLWYGTNYSREEIIQRFSAYPISYDFRTTYGYQNIMFIIAGEIVEAASGMSWDLFIQKHIFSPLGMNDSYTSINQYTEATKIAYPYVKGKLDKLRNYDNSGGAAALSSTIVDLTKWIQLWLNNGIINGDTILKPSTVSKLIDLHTPMSPSSFDRRNGISFKGYAQGWFLMDYAGEKVAHHGGGLPGYISKIFILPNKGFGGIILTNSESSLPTALMYASIDRYLKIENQKDWAATYLDFSKRYDQYLNKKEEERLAARNPKLKSNIPQENLIGTYTDKVYGKAEVSFVKGKLVFSMLASKELFTSEMSHWQQNTYQIKFSDSFLPAGYISFNSNADGEVVGLKIDLPNPDFHFHKLDFLKD